jgi:precorrin-6B methylase 1
MRTDEETSMLLNSLSMFMSTWTLLTSLGREGWLSKNVNLEERRLLVLTRNDDGPAEVIAAGADLAVLVLILISLADTDAAKK